MYLNMKLKKKFQNWNIKGIYLINGLECQKSYGVKSQDPRCYREII